MQINYSLADLEAFANRFYKGRSLLMTPYGYTTGFPGLAQGVVATNILNIAANADFMLLAVNHRAQIGAAQTVSAKTAPFVRLLITDSGSNEQYTAQAVDLENYSQNGIGAHTLPYPRIVSGRSTLTIQATNYAPTAETYTTLDVFLEGLLIRAYAA
jgi:hypothetical protein